MNLEIGQRIIVISNNKSGVIGDIYIDHDNGNISYGIAYDKTSVFKFNYFNENEIKE